MSNMIDISFLQRPNFFHRLTKEFYYNFWDDIKDTFTKSLKESKKLKYF